MSKIAAEASYVKAHKVYFYKELKKQWFVYYPAL